MGAQLRVRVRCVGICIAGGGQDGAALDARFFLVSVRSQKRAREVFTLTKTLLSQRHLLQLLKSVFLCGAVDDSVLQDVTIYGMVVDSRLDGAAVLVGCRLQFPRVASLVVHQAGVVIALVKIFQNRGEYRGFFVGECNALGSALHEVGAAQGILKERRCAEDVLVGGEEALFGADDEGDD